MKCPACKERLSSFDRQRGLSVHLVCVPDINACPKCGEPMTKCTTGSIRCRCLQPSMPKCIKGHGKGCNCFKDEQDRKPLTMQVRYGN